MIETKVSWIPISTLKRPDIPAYRAFLVSVRRDDDRLYTMSAYVNVAGDWLNSDGNPVLGTVYAIAEFPDPMPLGE